MAKELFPSSYKCDCGHESHFSENTIKELKRMSKTKKVRLGDSSKNDAHTIIFHEGEAIGIECQKLGHCKISDYE